MSVVNMLRAHNCGQYPAKIAAHCSKTEYIAALLVAACATYTSQFNLYMAYPSSPDKLWNFNSIIINVADKPTLFTVEMRMLSHTFRVQIHIVASILMNIPVFRQCLQISVDRSNANLFFLYCRHIV